MKKVLAAVVGLLALTLVGCGENAPKKPEATESAAPAEQAQAPASTEASPAAPAETDKSAAPAQPASETKSE